MFKDSCLNLSAIASIAPFRSLRTIISYSVHVRRARTSSTIVFVLPVPGGGEDIEMLSPAMLRSGGGRRKSYLCPAVQPLPSHLSAKVDWRSSSARHLIHFGCSESPF